MECQKKVLKMLFAPTFVNHYIVLDISFSQHCSINNHISISKKLINTYISYILNQWPRDLNTDFILGNFLFRSVKLKMMIQINTYILVMLLDSLPHGSVGKNLILFGIDMSSYVHIDNKNKVILIFGKGRTRGLDGTALTAEATYFINFTQL